MRNEAGAKPCAAAPWHGGLAARPWVFGATSDFRTLKCTRRSYWGNSAQLFPAPSRDILSNIGQLKSSMSLHANGKRFDAVKKKKRERTTRCRRLGRLGGLGVSRAAPPSRHRRSARTAPIPSYHDNKNGCKTGIFGCLPFLPFSGRPERRPEKRTSVSS